MRVLLVEDNVVNQAFAMALLGRRGATVTLAENGREAVKACTPGAFDVVLMDIQMPEMDGLEATAIIRSRETPGQHTPIIALTARGMPGDRELCLAAGMDAYVAKPLRIPELMKVIDGVTQRAANAPPASNPVHRSAIAPSDVFDFGRLQTNLGGDDALLDELLGLFFADSRGYLEAIKAASVAGDTDGLVDAAHAIKGSASAITADVVARAAHELEHAARGGDLSLHAVLIVRLETTVTELEGLVWSSGRIDAVPV